MTELRMRKLLKELKNQKHHFAIPEPDAGFEKRMLRSLRQSPEWNQRSLRDLWKKIFSFELNFLRITSVGFAGLLVFVTINSSIKESRHASRQLEVSTVAVPKRGHPELVSMLQRGGSAALQVWVQVNGDLTAQNTPEEAANAALSSEDQKRILAELEKKWAPAL